MLYSRDYLGGFTGCESRGYLVILFEYRAFFATKEAIDVG